MASAYSIRVVCSMVKNGNVKSQLSFLALKLTE